MKFMKIYKIKPIQYCPGIIELCAMKFTIIFLSVSILSILLEGYEDFTASMFQHIDIKVYKYIYIYIYVYKYTYLIRNKTSINK